MGEQIIMGNFQQGKVLLLYYYEDTWGATIYHLWSHRNSRIQENNYAPADTIFHLICGLQKVADSPANRSMCERWSFPLNILSPGRLAA